MIPANTRTHKMICRGGAPGINGSAAAEAAQTAQAE
jgi:hypothetical protein